MASTVITLHAIFSRDNSLGKRNNKSCPGELIHFDTKQLPLLKGQFTNEPREYLFVAIDDFSRELCADIFSDKTQHSAAGFLIDTVIAECPYQIDYTYSDNGKEFNGTDNHAFSKACTQHSRAYSRFISLNLSL